MRRTPSLLAALLLLLAAGCRREGAPLARPADGPATGGVQQGVQQGGAPPPPPRTPAAPMSWRGADWLTRESREREEQPERMLDALGLRPGMRVADVGAGVGYHTLRLARRVGPTGRVWATDVQEEMLERLGARVAAEGLSHVTPVLSGPDRTGLPPGAVDLVLMVDVFHEVAEPQAFLASLREALAPGGRLALVEFRAEDPAVPVREEHKMSVAQVDAELAAGGFVRVGRFDGLPRQHLLFYAPAPAPAPGAADGGR
jgi:SAM-dependent methyltransferase